MLFKRTSAPRAANVPVFMLLVYALLSFGADAKATEEAREARYAENQAEAQRIVDSYYDSGKFRREGLIVFAIVLV